MRRLNKEINIKRLVAAHRAGTSVAELARAYGVNSSTIYAHLHAAGGIPQKSSDQLPRWPRAAKGKPA